MDKTGEDACKICSSQSCLQRLETGSQLEAMLVNCANIQVTYPCLICIACSENVEKFNSFKDKVQKAFKHEDFAPDWSNISIDEENKENVPLNHSTPVRSSRNTSFTEQTEIYSSGAFICDDCGKKFHHKLLYIHHVRMHELDKRVKCATCRKSFSSSHKLQIHNRDKCSKSKAKIFNVVNDRTKLLVAAALHFANKSNEDEGPDEDNQEPSGYESSESQSIIYSDASSAFDLPSMDGSIIL